MCKSTVAPSSAKSRRPNDIRGACVRHSRRCACPRLNRDDLRRLPIEQRKEPAGLLRGSHPGVVLNEHYKGDGAPRVVSTGQSVSPRGEELAGALRVAFDRATRSAVAASVMNVEVVALAGRALRVAFDRATRSFVDVRLVSDDVEVAASPGP